MTDLPAHIVANPRLGTWLTTSEGQVEVRVGKVELGQGIVTALGQIAADALGLPLASIRMVKAHTRLGPDQGLTSGSKSVEHTAPALRHLGGVVRALTEGPVTPLAAYVDRIAALDPDTDLTDVEPAPPLEPREVGRSARRVDLPDKVFGRPRYLADLRPEGLMHGRVLRPPSIGATLIELAPDWTLRDGSSLASSGTEFRGVELVRDGSFVGVVGEREADVDRALEQLERDCRWEEPDLLPDEDDLPGWLREGPHEEIAVLNEGPPAAAHTASYSKPFLAHASIAPSCGMALWHDAGLHVWSHSQGIHGLGEAIATALDLDPAAVEVEHVENAGCYGHNGADDAALDAVLLARVVPGRPVLARWSRRDELGWAPLSSAMAATVSASLEGGRITGWSHDVWSQGHAARPGSRGAPALLAGAHLETPAPLPVPTDPPLVAGGGTTRNATPIYAVGPRRITGHRKAETPLRSSAMRSLGAYLNVFAIESFVDELAAIGGADPVRFRLDHLEDPRARQVVETAARLSDWGAPLPEEVGRGIGFARYKGVGAWCAVVAEVAAESDVRVRRLTVVADIGTVVNPDGARNQLEGGAVQATSWTLMERVRFDRRRITSDDWESYPILGFGEAPPVAVHLVESDQPSVGAGEAAQGPTAAAVANALHNALGVRVRDLPLDAAAIVRAIGAQEEEE
jgi:nicotinate dehydrogenase subunit B